MVSVRSALLDTLKDADAVVLFEPTEVTSDPEGMVFVKVPDTELVTTTLNEHEAFGGINVPCAKVTVPNPIVALAVPGLQVVEATEPKLTRPGGYVSVKVVDKVADTNACVLVTVIVNKVVPPPEILEGEKLLETTGLEGVTRSPSAAEHTPPVHDVAVLAFVTLAGGEITAVLVICVCAIADKLPNTSKNTTAACDSKRRTQETDCNRTAKKPTAL